MSRKKHPKKNKFMQLFCRHKYYADTQLNIMVCDKCGKAFWYTVKDMFT